VQRDDWPAPTNSTGGFHAELRYKPWGETRYTSGTTPTSVHFTGHHEESGLGGLYFYDARWYAPYINRSVQPDSDVPASQGPQGLNRYSFVVNNPLKYVDPDGHNPIIFGLVVLGAAYVTARVGWEVADSTVPLMYQGTRDVLGGALVTDASEAITAQAAQQSVDPTLVGAVLRHESPPGERRIFTFLPMTQPGALANMAETVEAYLRTDGTASIGPAQMQLRRAEMLENGGYVTARGSKAERIQALLGTDSSVEYVAGMLHYISDQLNTLPGFSGLSQETQQRLILLGYNQGWTDQFLENINSLGFERFVQEAQYDNRTLDEYRRWLQQSGGH
jgi:RHS repeat-associated protein